MNPSRIVRIPVAVAIVGTLVLGASLVAEAHSYAVASSVSIDYRGGAFSGKVGSSKAACRSGRTVVVKRVTKGADRTIGSTRSSSTGSWSVAETNASGRFYATVAARSKGKYGHSHRCRATTSSKVRVNS